MGFIFGKYGIYIEFNDGEKGFVMGVRGDHVMITSSFQNAEKFMSQGAAENYFYNKGVGSGSNSNFSGVKAAWVYSDGKFFRM
ncbi:MAG: hypothetical protein E7175_03440 [Erysipelotrichaceae bacterium]|nr:hypothetical protein [Erysipelotrichaceae bacterium]